MHGGPTVKTRKIRIIKNAPMFLLSFVADSAWEYKQDRPGERGWLSPVGRT
jgi:hypothetical protein